MTQYIIPENLVHMIDGYCRSQMPVQILAGLQGLADHIEPEEDKKEDVVEPKKEETE